MTEQILTHLQLPPQCLVSEKLTKAFFKRNFELTRSERQLLDDAEAITGMDWLATLAPATINVPAYHEGNLLIEEIQIIALHTSHAKWTSLTTRLIELLQKHIPYHLLTFITHADGWIINTTEKFVNQNDNQLRVLGRMLTTPLLPWQATDSLQLAFTNSLGFGGKDTTHLLSLYQSYSQAIIGLLAAGYSGQFACRPAFRTATDMALLDQMATISRNIALWEKEARQESQLNRRVLLNTQIQQARQQLNNLTLQLAQ